MPAPFTGGVVQTTYYSAYNSLGQPTTITEPNNKVTTLDYDVRGRLRLSSTTDGTTTLATRIGYYPNGLVQYVISPDSTYLKYVYNNAHQLTDVYQRVLSGGDPSDTDALLGHVHYTPSVLDGKWTDAITYGTNDSSVVLAQHRVFDAIGRLRILKDAANSENKTEMSYDANDNLKAIVALGSGVSGYDNDNHVTYREFDKQNRIKCTMDTAPSAPSTCMGAAVSTRYAYDDQGNIAKVTDANGHETDYNYNGFGELVTLVSPETGTTTFEYDHAGNLHIKTKAAQLEETDTDQQVITYTWDALNRLINIDYAQPGTTSQEVSYTYDEHNAVHGAGIGHLTTVVDGSGTTAYKYDSLGGVTQKQQTLPGSLVRTTGYHYDSVHRLDSVTYPSGEVIAVGYNSTSKQLDYLTDGGAALISAVTHQPFGGLTGWQTNSGTDLINQYVRTFDTEGRLDQWGVANHTSLASRMRQLQYDAYSGISGVQNLSDPTRDEQYEYDVQSRLTKVTAEYGRITYGYDNVGNRTSKFFEQLNPTSQIWSELYTEIYSYINPATTTVDSNRVYAIARTRGGSTGLSMREFSYNHRGNVKQDIRQKVSELSPRTYGLNYGNNDRLNIISAP
jgi:YD repeat-containing protein